MRNALDGIGAIIPAFTAYSDHLFESDGLARPPVERVTLSLADPSDTS